MRAYTAVLATGIAVGLLTGCQRSPFSQDIPRTPYERYQLLRGDAPPVSELDTYGNKRPALRARLGPSARR